MTEGGEHKVHHGGATFDIGGSGSINTVAFGLPVEVVAFLLFGWEDRIEVGYQGNGTETCTAARHDEVISTGGVMVRNIFRREAEFCEIAGGACRNLIDALSVSREAIDRDETAKEFKVLGKALVQVTK
jgi:hypothetical protein